MADPETTETPETPDAAAAPEEQPAPPVAETPEEAPPEAPPGEGAEAGEASPHGISDGIPPMNLQAPENFKAAAKCLGLFIILAVIYFWNLYCIRFVVPKVEKTFKDQHIELNDAQKRFINISHTIEKNAYIGYLPVLILMACGIGSLLTRHWALFSGVFFTLIVALFLVFLYGWVVFALPLIQIQQNAPSGDPGGPVPVTPVPK